jgi:hypothetical protein
MDVPRARMARIGKSVLVKFLQVPPIDELDAER